MKHIIYFIPFAPVFALLSCNGYQDRAIKKTIPLTRGRSIEWYYYDGGSSGGSSPDYIDIKEKNGDRQHILITSRICDVNVYADTLKIFTDKSSHTSFLEKNNFSLKLNIDSTTYCTRWQGATK